jgi:hypothetical protein
MVQAVKVKVLGAKVIKSMITAMLVALALASCTTTELCSSTDKKLEWSSSCFEGVEAVRRVKPEYTKKIMANQSGYATIMISNPRELVAVDRSGVVTIPNIFHTADFDFPSARAGLGRFQALTKNGKGESIAKCGYFDALTLQITIPATYDHCQPFVQGVAAVCNGCATYCTEPECQSNIFVGGRGFAIDSKNKVLGQFAPPSLAKACGGGTTAKVVKITEAISYVQCTPAANSPFGRLQ